MNRKYEFPEQVQKKEFQFGQKIGGYIDMKEIISNGDHIRETPETKKLYTKTHGLTDPGQQKERNYNWDNTGLNPKQHVFGYGFEKEQDGAKKSLQTDYLNTNYMKTIIAKKSLEDFRQANCEMIGKTKFKGALRQDLPEGHTFGLQTIVGGGWNVGNYSINKFKGKCLNGDLTNKKPDFNKPDIDLSTEQRFNKPRVQTAKPVNHDPNRIFGTPSIRKDINCPYDNYEKKSLTNPNVNNYYIS